MASANPVVRSAGGLERSLHPGDSLLVSRIFTPITTVGAGTWTAAAIVGGVIRRSGPTAAYADTIDTADNILRALRGNAIGAGSMIGLSLDVYVANTVAFANTLAAGRGIVLGTQGGSVNIPASATNEYLFTIQNDSPEVTLQGSGTGNTVFNFTIPAGQSSLLMGPAPGSLNLTPGMLVSLGGGTGTITAGTVVTGIRMGQGGIVGVTCSQNIPATVTALILSPKIEVNSIGL